jgi:hypothetical protein
MHFILTSKDENYPWIAEQVKYAEMQRHTHREWNGRNHLAYRYTWVNGIENRAERYCRSIGRRDAFFWALRYEVSRYLYQNWHELLLTIAGDAPDG